MDFKEDFYKILFEGIREGLILVDINGIIVDLNKPANSMFGYENDELIGKNIDQLVPAAKRSSHSKQRKQYSHHPTTRLMGAALKLDGVKKNGEEFPVQVSLNPFKDTDGEDYVVTLISDITERRENEMKLAKLRESLEQKVKERTEELRESERLYKSIARNFPSGIICIFDRDYKYQFAEGQGLYELNIETSDLIGLDYLERIDEEARGHVKHELDLAFEGKSRDFEVYVGGRTYRINAVPLPDESGNVDRILVVEQNISAQKEVAKRLEETLNQERELTEMKSRFVSMASHEFRTPLTTVNSSASLIKKHLEKGSYDRILKHAERIKNAVHNLNSILNDFLSFEKLEAGKVNANFSEVNVTELLFETFDEMVDITKEKQKIVYEGPDNLILETDGQLLKNTVLNILSNAVKYSFEDGKIIVGVKEDEHKVVISIQDFGVGIPEADQKNLFTRFFRAGNVTNIQGTGLGLNIVLRYLDLLDGVISFESKEGEGTTFFITLQK
ncbi:MAG: PAS domain S-box protein [Brumimicrobium sp.]